MTPEQQVRFWAKVDKTPTCWIWNGSHVRPALEEFWGSGT